MIRIFKKSIGIYLKNHQPWQSGFQFHMRCITFGCANVWTTPSNNQKNKHLFQYCHLFLCIYIYMYIYISLSLSLSLSLFLVPRISKTTKPYIYFWHVFKSSNAFKTLFELSWMHLQHHSKLINPLSHLNIWVNFETSRYCLSDSRIPNRQVS